MPFSVHVESNLLKRLKITFKALPDDAKDIYVAFSGGLDSHVLLHATQQVFPQKVIKAIHVNHGLQAKALYFEQHCEAICKALAIPLVVRSVQLAIKQYRALGYSPEDAARKARYQAFSDVLNDKDCLLTGHHLEDQSETLLLQLMRGAGVKGLGGMRLLTQLSSIYLMRPLLQWKHTERLQYAKKYQLQWIEDPTNHNQSFARNFIRHTVIPTFKKHWPSVTQTLQKTASYLKEASDLCLEIAIEDLVRCQIEPHILSVQSLLSFSLLRRRNVLRHWLHTHLGKYPNAVQCESIENLLYTEPQAGIMLEGVAMTIKRYRNHLYLLPKQNTPTNTLLPIQWCFNQPFIRTHGMTLKSSTDKIEGIQPLALQKNSVVEIRFRKGGERFHPKGRIGSHPLKKLFQEWGIPPWKRYRWPLIYYHNELIAVPNYAVSAKYAATKKDARLWISVTDSTTMSL